MKEAERERRASRRFRLRLAGGVLLARRTRDHAEQRRLQLQHKRPWYLRANEIRAASWKFSRDEGVSSSACLRYSRAEIRANGQVTRIDQGLQAQGCGFAAMNRTVLIRESIEHVLDEKNGAEHSSRGAQQRIQAKQNIGLRRS
jgi:hypothetical protein